MDSFRNNLPVGYWITTQLIRDDLPRRSTTRPQQTLEEPLRCSPIPLRLQVYINDLPVLVYRSPKVMPLTLDFDEYLINVEGVAVSAVIAF